MKDIGKTIAGIIILIEGFLFVCVGYVDANMFRILSGICFILLGTLFYFQSKKM